MILGGKRFQVDDLYFGILGYVTKKNGTLSITQVQKFLFFKKVSVGYGEAAQNIFTNNKYFFFHGNAYPWHTIEKAINSFAIFNYVPIELLLDNQKKTITEKKLLELYQELKSSILKEKNKPVLDQPVTDSILKTILDTNELVKNSFIDQRLKEEIIQDLELLGEYYVNSLIKITENTDATLNEYGLKMECMRRLVKIEEKFKNPQVSKVHSLRKQLKQFKNELK